MSTRNPFAHDPVKSQLWMRASPYAIELPPPPADPKLRAAVEILREVKEEESRQSMALMVAMLTGEDLTPHIPKGAHYAPGMPVVVDDFAMHGMNAGGVCFIVGASEHIFRFDLAMDATGKLGSNLPGSRSDHPGARPATAGELEETIAGMAPAAADLVLKALDFADRHAGKGGDDDVPF